MNNKPISTGWTKATASIEVALLGMMACIDAGKNAWIEVQKNGDQAFPILITNPLLDDPFNWTMMYGAPRNEKALESHRYLNATDKDLTHNWVAAFSDKDAAETYRLTGVVEKGLFFGMGVCTPVRIIDANKYRAEVVGDNYTYGSWTTFWTPKHGIPYNVPAEISEVFVVCYNDDKAPSKAEAYTRLADVLLTLAQQAE